MNRLKFFLFFALAVGSIYKEIEAKPKAEFKAAQTRRTVRDYYLRLPSSYFLESSSENLRKRSMIIDIANDFIETSGEKGQPYLQTSLFRHRSIELFAVYAQLEQGDVLKFYRWRDGQLRDVTRQVWRVKPRPYDRIYSAQRILRYPFKNA